jgi:hypothetical protein
MASRTITNSRFIVWILGGAVALCLCSCDRLSTSGRTAEPNPTVQTTITPRAVGSVAQAAESIPVQAIAAQAIALATEIARPTQTSTPTITPTVTNTPSPTATPTATTDARVLNPDNQHLYLNVQRLLSWHQARDYCASLGGHLVTIQSQFEDSFVYDLDPWGWIGLSDELQEGSWQWVTGEPLTYTNWAPGQPDPQPEDYAHYQSDGWHDWPILVGSSFVCEWEPVSP